MPGERGKREPAERFLRVNADCKIRKNPPMMKTEMKVDKPFRGLKC